MAKKLIIETEVKTDQIDAAAAKLGELKDLGKGLKIQYDIDGKPIDVVIDKSLNLQKQVRTLTAELRKTKEGTAEFKLLSSTLSDTQDKLAQSNAKSRDLLGSLQLIPGPIGDIASKLNGTISLLKTFTSFSFKDLQFQIKETANDIGDVIDNIFGLGKAASDTGKIAAEAKDAAATAANTGSEKLNTVAIAENTKEQAINADAKIKDAAATKATTIATQQNTLANIESNIVLKQQQAEWVKNEIAKLNAAVAEGDLTAARKINILAYEQEKTLTALNTLETEKNTLAKEANTVATNGLSKALTRFIAIVTSAQAAILGIVTAIGLLGYKLYQYVTETTAAEEATKAFKETLLKGATASEEAKNKVLEVGAAFEQAKSGAISKKKALETYNEVLGGTIGKADTLAEAEKLYKDNTENYVKATGLRAQAQELFRIAAQKSAEAITAQEVGFFSFDRRLGESYEDELKRRRKNLTDASTEIRKKATDLLKEAGSLETGFKPKEDKKTGGADEAYNKLLKDLDARIQLEINKENTSRKVLQGLLDEKRKLVINHDKLTYSEAELLRQENSKKLEAALEEDNKIIQDKVQKREELRVSAIADEQQREEEARADKLYFDKIAKQKELKNEEEYYAAVKNLEIVYERDILAIRDKYFQKKFKQQQEAQLKENQLYTQGKELETKVNQQRLDDGIKFNELYGDYIFGDKGLKAMLEKRFIDLRKVYNEEYDANEEQFRKDEEQLKFNLDNKKITQETYDTEVKNIADKRVQNAQTNTERQLQLDKLEVDSKRASADMTIQIGQNLTSLLSAIAGKNVKLQKAAAILDAGVSIARIVTDTSRAIIAFSASVAPLGPAGVPIAAGYALKAKIGAGLAIATIIAQGIGKLKSIDENSLSDSATGGQGTSSTARGMEKGGMINGNRHSKGGVMINAEGGEAVMTRGAVSLFGPMLSMMNQAGGGASFNSNLLTTRQDKPLVSTPSVDDKPLIVKTYMVERELTSYQNKQARLKDLSTL